MRIAVTYGPMCIQPHRTAQETWDDPRTGSEIGWRRIVEGLRGHGHHVDVHPLGAAVAIRQYDAAVSINEPDTLRDVNASHRVCMFWLNEFSFCKEGFDDHVDAYFSPSEAHRKKAIGDWGAPRSEKWRANLLGCDLPGAVAEGHHQVSRISGRVVYASSPDRGLHRVLEAWPAIKRAAPHGQLRIFYRLQPWIDQLKATPYHPPIERNRTRALYIEEALARMRGPEWGITVVDSVSHDQALDEMAQAELLLHPCETLSWSEGFSVTIVDACSRGCVPIISDCDALGEVYSTLEPVPVGQWGKWRDQVIRGLTDAEFRRDMQERAGKLARELTWTSHVSRLNDYLMTHFATKLAGLPTLPLVSSPASDSFGAALAPIVPGTTT